MDELLDKIAYLRDLTGRPVGVKTAIGGWEFVNELCDTVLRRGLEYAPDFLAIDGGEGGSGAAPQTLDGPHGAADRRGAAARGGFAAAVRT